jgi:hypothetical protein
VDERAVCALAVVTQQAAGFGLKSSLVLDGVFARNPAGALNFHPTDRLTALDIEEVLATVEPRIKRLLDRRGLGRGIGIYSRLRAISSLSHLRRRDA